MSLRARLLVAMAAVAVVLAAAAVVVTRTTEAHLVGQVDAQLAAAGGAGRLMGDRTGTGAFGGGRGDTFERPSALYGALFGPNGALLARFTPNLSENEPPLPSVAAVEAFAGARTFAPFTVGSEPPGVRYRVLAQPAPRRTVLVVALPLSDVDSAVDRLIALQALATGVVVGVLALVTYWVLRLGVRPVKQMAAAAATIAAGDLSQRVPDAEDGTEAGELGVALNQMLARIEEAFDERTRSQERLRRFVADASHELRTPVTTIRGYAELYRAGGLDDVADRDEAMRRTEEEALRMGGLIEDLLLLARLDEGRPLQRDPVDLAVLVHDAVRDAHVVEPTRPMTVDVEAAGGGGFSIAGDEGRLRQVIANLVGNARVHTLPGTPVEVRLRSDGDRTVLEVHDDGPGMAADDAARAFERFYRADASRARHRGGSGLGLAIVHAAVTAHGGTVDIDSTPEAGTTVRVELPRR